MTERTLYTIGYGKMTPEDMDRVLGAFSIEKLIDVRSKPETGREQFRRAVLEEKYGERYESWPQLGGRGVKEPYPIEQLQPLMDLAAQKRVAIMCTCGRTWNCHRSLYVGAPIFRSGWGQVLHIQPNGKATPTKY